MIQGCLQVHVWRAAPVTRCAAAYADTTGEVGSTRHDGPTGSLPAGGSTAWAMGRVDVAAASPDGKWRTIATTADGGAPAAIALSADHPDPPPRGVDIGSGAGGFNSGGIGSFCIASPMTSDAALPAGGRANALGADVPAYSEFGLPIGTAADHSPRDRAGVARRRLGDGRTGCRRGRAARGRPLAPPRLARRQRQLLRLR